MKKLFTLLFILLIGIISKAQNTKYGTNALFSNTTGTNNSAFGAKSVYKNTSGNSNTASGFQSLLSNLSGNNNTAVGYNALYTNTTGSSNTALGYSANVSSGTLTNATAIGNGAIVTLSNAIQLGNSTVTKVFAGTTNKATLIAGGLQITGGTLGAGKVLTSDATGIATWQTPAAGSNWSLTGNIGTVAGTNFIGTKDAVDLVLKTSNTEKMRVTSTGNVGIGNISPTHTLDITTTKAIDGVRLSHTPNGFWAKLLAGSLGQGSYNSVSQPNDAGIIFGGVQPGEGPGFVIAPWAVAAGGLRVSNKGMVTVSTYNSLEAFSIKHSNNYWTNYFAGSLGQTSYNPISQTNDGGIIFGGPQVNTGPGFVIAPWNLSSGGIRLDNQGNVAIGIIENIKPGYKLFVQQGILTEKVRVAVKNSGDWADYVFDKKHELPSLQQVEDFIKKNQHLPGIPSADEVVAEGIDLGKMDAKLLSKIEELTLYMIEMNKKIEKLEKDNESLKSTITNAQNK